LFSAKEKGGKWGAKEHRQANSHQGLVSLWSRGSAGKRRKNTAIKDRKRETHFNTGLEKGLFCFEENWDMEPLLALQESPVK